MIKRGVAWHRWKHRLSQYWNSGLSLSEYCRQHDLNLKTASKWRSRLLSEHPGHDEALEIVPLNLNLPSDLSPPPIPAVRSGDSGILLALGHLRINLAVDFDAACLERVLSVLEVK